MFRKKSVWLYLLPGLVGLLAFYLVPFVWGIWFSLTDGTIDNRFVGFDNYLRVWQNEVFQLGLKNTIELSLLCAPVIFVLSFLLAGMLRKPSGKSRLWLLADMLRCALKYNAGYVDYKIAQMYRLNDAQRKTQITRGLSNQIVRRMNDKAYWYLFDDKATFNELFKEEVGRGWMKLSPDTDPEAFKAFLAAHPDIIAKPLEGSSGVGIARYTQDDWQGREDDFLKELLPVTPLPVILVSSLNLKVFDALAAGAVDFVRKPDGTESKQSFLDSLAQKIVVASCAKVRRRAAVSPAAPSLSSVSPAGVGGRSDLDRTIIGLGASTGGTEATLEVLKPISPAW